MGFERTFVMLKPDAVARGLIGEIIGRIERKGLTISAMRMERLSRKTVESHYAEHRGKPFFEGLVEFVCSGPVVLMVIEGLSAISVMRKLAGKTAGTEADAGTIRGDLALSNRYNLIHASDSPESAEREIKRFFEDAKFFEASPERLRWIYDAAERPGGGGRS
ncbi:MAG: nucleoside-diphosphate kinase [Planctomycetota bacterium]|nr:nucleoside-diphosphate kinase [Planctomycetota bacterium]